MGISEFISNFNILHKMMAEYWQALESDKENDRNFYPSDLANKMEAVIENGGSPYDPASYSDLGHFERLLLKGFASSGHPPEDTVQFLRSRPELGIEHSPEGDTKELRDAFLAFQEKEPEVYHAFINNPIISRTSQFLKKVGSGENVDPSFWEAGLMIFELMKYVLNEVRSSITEEKLLAYENELIEKGLIPTATQSLTRKPTAIIRI
ncbi:MAG: hypothetical protein H6908_01940 [Hyphomicrobiales bacterium]|nr:hypothetical protein [Hyphomicrobiales bacterium]